MDQTTAPAEIPPLYETAVGKILRDHPELHYGGYGGRHREEGDRERLEADPVHIIRVAAWFRDHPVPARDLKHRTSYGFKHDAERGLGETYVSNGQAIAALLLAGYEIAEPGGNPRFTDPARATAVKSPLEELEAAEFEAMMRSDSRARQVTVDGETIWVTGTPCPFGCEFEVHEYCLYDCADSPRPSGCQCGMHTCPCDCAHCEEQRQWQAEFDARLAEDKRAQEQWRAGHPEAATAAPGLTGKQRAAVAARLPEFEADPGFAEYKALQEAATAVTQQPAAWDEAVQWLSALGVEDAGFKLDKTRLEQQRRPRRTRRRIRL